MRFPYGISNFSKIMTDDYLYFDRTDRIPLIEAAGSNLLFLHPRRFGKSLLLSMLENYYDFAKADKFEQLFGELAIAQNPTPLRNRFYVLHWDFSWIDTHGDVQQIRQSLHNHINGQIQSFANRYRYQLSYPIDIDHRDALSSFRSLLMAIQETQFRLYLFIDSYDSGANELLLEPRIATRERFESLVSSEGILRTIFRGIKAASASMGLDRIFITGVSPSIMGELTGGYNETTRIDTELEFADLCGVHEYELEESLAYIAQECELDEAKVDAARNLMRNYYCGYTFNHSQRQPLYHPAGAIYFLQELHKRFNPPAQLVDTSAAADRGRLAYMFNQPGGDSVVLAALNENAPLAIDQSSNRFGMSITSTSPKDPVLMTSVLYDFGLLTLAGQDGLGKSQMCIPNLMVRGLYADQIRDTLLLNPTTRGENLAVSETFYGSGDMKVVSKFIEEDVFRLYQNRDFRWTSELTPKSLFLSLLWNDRLYVMDWEPGLDNGSEEGFVPMTTSMTMIRRADARKFQSLDFVFEFRHLSTAELGLEAEQARTLDLAVLKDQPTIRTALDSATTALAGKRDQLLAHYGDQLRLRAFALIFINAERIVWEEIPVAQPAPSMPGPTTPVAQAAPVTQPDAAVTIQPTSEELTEELIGEDQQLPSSASTAAVNANGESTKTDELITDDDYATPNDYDTDDGDAPLWRVVTTEPVLAHINGVGV